MVFGLWPKANLWWFYVSFVLFMGCWLCLMVNATWNIIEGVGDHYYNTLPYGNSPATSSRTMPLFHCAAYGPALISRSISRPSTRRPKAWKAVTGGMSRCRLNIGAYGRYLSKYRIGHSVQSLVSRIIFQNGFRKWKSNGRVQEQGSELSTQEKSARAFEIIYYYVWFKSLSLEKI
jgi:hypothetical protein